MNIRRPGSACRTAGFAGVALVSFFLVTAGSTAFAAQCSDGQDNDADGGIDVLENGGDENATFSIGAGNPFGGVRGFVNANADLFGYSQIPTNSAVHNDAATALKLCQIAGYTDVVSVSCEAPAYGNRCGYASFGDNGMYKWNGSNFVPINDNVWISSVTCKGLAAACGDGRDNDGDGRTDMADSGCATDRDASEVPDDANCTTAQDTSESGAGQLEIEMIAPDTVRPGGTATFSFVLTNTSGVMAQNVNTYLFFLDDDRTQYMPFELDGGKGATCEMDTFYSGFTQVHCPAGLITDAWQMGAGEEKRFSITFKVPSDAKCDDVIPSHVDAWIDGNPNVGADFNDGDTLVDCDGGDDGGGDNGGGAAAGGGDIGGDAAGGGGGDVGGGGGGGGDDPPMCPVACQADADCPGEEKCSKDWRDPTKDLCWMDADLKACVKKCLIPRCIAGTCEMSPPSRESPTYPYVACEEENCGAPVCGDGVVQGKGADEDGDGDPSACPGDYPQCASGKNPPQPATCPSGQTVEWWGGSNTHLCDIPNYGGGRCYRCTGNTTPDGGNSCGPVPGVNCTGGMWVQQQNGSCICVMVSLPGTSPTAPIASVLSAQAVGADNGEECDDGNTKDGDGCTSSCKKEVCGDGAVQAKGTDGTPNTADDEMCDDGNRDVGDGCDNHCKVEVCGNGIQDFGEECDKGLQNSDTEPGACRTDCTLAACNDGVIDTPIGEQCDCGDEGDGSCDVTVNGHAASCDKATCKANYCGDGVISNAGMDQELGTADDEMCDEGPKNSNNPGDVGGCRLDCKPVRCGDGIVDDDAGETCDQGQSMYRCSGYPQPLCNCGIPSWGSTTRPGGGAFDTTCCAANQYCMNAGTASCPSDCGLMGDPDIKCGNGLYDSGEECDVSTRGKLYVFRPNRDGTKLSFIQDNGGWGVVPASIEKKYTTVDHEPAPVSPDGAWIKSKKDAPVTYFHLWDVAFSQGDAVKVVARAGVDFSGNGTDWRVLEVVLPLVNNQHFSLREMNGAILSVTGDQVKHELSLALYNASTGRALTGVGTMVSPVLVTGMPPIAVDALEVVVWGSPFADGTSCNDQCKLKRCGNTLTEEDLGESCDDGNAESGDGCNDQCVVEICALP